MENNEEKVPPFVREYLEKMEYEGYADFVNLSRRYYKEREEYPSKFAEQSAHLNDFNRRSGQNKSLNYDDELQRMDGRYKKLAYETAQKHGFKGTDPNQPSDKELSKQGAKFQGMIDKARQPKPEQQQQASRGKEAENIETLKDLKSYQQNIPKVEFKGVGDQSSGTQEQTLQQQRVAFLEQIKKTREQMTQQQDRQAEI